jgi:hypothetical protein
MGGDPRGYRFHPLERRGVVLGLEVPQLATIAAGVLAALVVLRSSPGTTGLVEAAGTAVALAAAACWPLAGRTPVGWAPVAGRWLLSRARPARVASAGSAAPPAGVRLLDAPRAPGDEPLGVVRDRRAGTWAAAIPVAGRGFTLLDPEDKRRRLAAWGAVLAGLARAGSPVHRIQWLERTVPGDSRALAAYLAEAGSGQAVPGSEASYRQLIERAAPAAPGHELLLVVSIHPRLAGRQLRTFGGGVTGACALLRRELRLLRGQLRRAELDPGAALDLPGLAACVRGGSAPGAARTTATDDAGAWPLGWSDAWSVARIDGRWHATYWIAEWPRTEVGPDFLVPLLFAPGQRTVSVTMAPVPPQRAAREVESARTAELADEELRRRAGFLETARHRRRAEGVAHREAELADGHAELRFSGYVSVSGPTPAELDEACAAVEAAAQQTGLELRRLYGQQAEAFTWCLPLARGLA